MMAGLSSKTAFRAGAGLPLVLLGSLLLAGCGADSYPEDLNYIPRSDPIVLKTPDGSPTQLDAPGHLEQWIDSLPGRGGKLIDPTTTLEKRQLAKINEYLGRSQFNLSEEEARAVGLTSKPEPDAAKALLEGRQTALNKTIQNTTDKMATGRPALDAALKDLFGTPAKPKVALDDPDPKLAEATLAKGSSLYRRHCLHCHGLTGDGRGPTGPWVNPHPRDYREGKFKFTSTFVGTGLRKARREDLVRTLKSGIEGTSMPSFALLDEPTEIEPLVSYVIHLSLRGQVELAILKDLLGSDSDLTAAAIPAEAKERLEKAWKNGWQATDDKPIEVTPAPSYAGKTDDLLSDVQRGELKESMRRGFVLFTTGKAECRKCHGDFGRANTYLYDDWGTIVRPANLTLGIYRGGRRPLDLYYRIHSGVNGVGMPAFGKLKPEDPGLEGSDIWDIVNFLEALPYKSMLPTDVKDQVYGKE